VCVRQVGKKKETKGTHTTHISVRVVYGADPLCSFLLLLRDIKVPEHVISGLKVQRLGT